MLSTLLTVVGQPHTPIFAGNGGFSLGWPFLAFKTFDQRHFLAADVGPCPAVNVDIVLPARTAGVFAEVARVVGFLNRGFKVLGLTNEFATDIDVASVRAHRETGNQAPFDQLVWVMPHQVAVFASAGFAFVGVDDKVVWSSIGFLGHEGPLQSGRESGAAAATQTRGFDFVDDLVTTQVEQRLGVVPVATRFCAREAPIMGTVQVGKDPVFVLQHQTVCSLSVVGPPIGADVWRPLCDPGGGVSPRAQCVDNPAHGVCVDIFVVVIADPDGRRIDARPKAFDLAQGEHPVFGCSVEINAECLPAGRDNVTAAAQFARGSRADPNEVFTDRCKIVHRVKGRDFVGAHP